MWGAVAVEGTMDSGLGGELGIKAGSVKEV
jgi:hypothetical protein